MDIIDNLNVVEKFADNAVSTGVEKQDCFVCDESEKNFRLAYHAVVQHYSIARVKMSR